MNGSVASFVKKIERRLGGLSQSDSEEVQKLIALLPLTWGILERHRGAQHAASKLLLEAVRDPLYQLNQATEYMRAFYVFRTLRPMLKQRFPQVEREIAQAVQREAAKFPPVPEHVRDMRR